MATNSARSRILVYPLLGCAGFALLFSFYTVSMVALITFLDQNATKELGNLIRLGDSILTANIRDSMRVIMGERSFEAAIRTLSVRRSLGAMNLTVFHFLVGGITFLCFGLLAGRLRVLSVALIYPILLFPVTQGFLGSRLVGIDNPSFMTLALLLATELLMTYLGTLWSGWLSAE